MGMEWAISKSCCLKLPFPIQIRGQELPDADVVTYLGITDQKLRDLLCAAYNKMRKLLRIIKPWNTSLRQRRQLVKTFVLSLIDYLLYLQHLTSKVTQEVTDIELDCLKFIMGVHITRRQAQRAQAVCEILPLGARRRPHRIKLVAKFYGQMKRHNRTQSEIKN